MLRGRSSVESIGAARSPAGNKHSKRRERKKRNHRNYKRALIIGIGAGCILRVRSIVRHGDPSTSYKEPVSIEENWRAGDKGGNVLALFDAQVLKIIRLNSANVIYPVSNSTVSSCEVEHITATKFRKPGEKRLIRDAGVPCNDRMRAPSTYRQTGTVQVACTILQRIISGSMANGKININTWNSNGTHDAVAKIKLTLVINIILESEITNTSGVRIDSLPNDLRRIRKSTVVFTRLAYHSTISAKRSRISMESSLGLPLSIALTLILLHTNPCECSKSSHDKNKSYGNKYAKCTSAPHPILKTAAPMGARLVGETSIKNVVPVQCGGLVHHQPCTLYRYASVYRKRDRC